MEDLILEEIHRVQHDETTPIAAANTIADWCEENVNNAIAEESNGWREIREEKEIRIANLQHASWTTGIPDMFSDEMRGFWNA